MKKILNFLCACLLGAVLGIMFAVGIMGITLGQFLTLFI
jgi:hypothetical protein